jgi:predicted component of type VI protein secretion system
VGRVAVALAACAASAAFALETQIQVPMRDPWVPPAVRKAAREEPASAQGPALRARVAEKLRQPFERAAVGGALTQAQARAAGLGFIERHFQEIDRSGAGTITFDDYRAFLRARGANLD